MRTGLIPINRSASRSWATAAMARPTKVNLRNADRIANTASAPIAGTNMRSGKSILPIERTPLVDSASSETADPRPDQQQRDLDQEHQAEEEGEAAERPLARLSNKK